MNLTCLSFIFLSLENFSKFFESFIEDRYGASNRETAATQCNSTSSRSHYVFSMKLVDPEQPDLSLASFNLLDLAGSERNENTLYHQADRIKEQCQINTSLMCLKNCMHGWAENQKNEKKVRIPFREAKVQFSFQNTLNSNSNLFILFQIPILFFFIASKLTLYLRDCFETIGAGEQNLNKNPYHLVVIATISPSSTDTEHSTTTLK